MAQSFKALSVASVEGVVVEVWWGLVEREKPRVYNRQGHLDLVALVKRCGLKVRVVMAFHQCATGPGNPHWSI
ncbi:beta-amylase 1 [Quercus suber]|uniref:Beta-amylase n=1 Tax=Quercus suber TaxID=58331 RepID=A0AAW0MC01_QUESU|nr:beta-amylase 1, chloroplastic [Quercus suber]